MAAKWPILSLREANVTLIDCDHRTPPATEVGYPYVMIPQLQNGRLDLTQTRRITPAHFIEWTRKAKPVANDVVLSRRCNPGETAFVDDGMEFALGQNLVLLRADGSKIYPPFLRWLVRGPEWWDQVNKFLNVGAIFDSLKCADVPKFELQIPSLKEQKTITDILSALDDKIELNRQTNATLEAMAQAIFKEWFVDFNYPGATGDLVDSELGLIPAGWRISTFEEELDAVRGLSYRGDGLEDKDAIPMHNLNSVYEGGGYKFEGIKYYSGEYKEKHVVKPGDLIIANTEQGHKYLLIGYPAIVPALFGEQGIYSHHIYRVRAKSHSYLTSDFLYFLLLLPEVRDQVTGFANGTTVNMLKIEGLQKPRFVRPPEKLVAKFSETSRNIRLRKEEMIKQSSVLAQIRDALLPKLMRGEIEI